MYGTKGMAAITLYPEKAYIEIKGQLYNPTDLPQTFLWWANPAVPVNDNTYSVFPPDVNAVMDHGKRAVSTFPIATGEYYKADYSAGVDISRYKNVKVPTSYMAAHSDYNFIGNYDEGVKAGLLHVADHHISPGKKQWTWGNGDFGRSWDRNLTETDGPYIELMTGVFTDNQPDFTWLKPQEEKTFVQSFMPYKGVGRVGNATQEAAVSLTDLGDGHAVLKVYTTGVRKDTRITVKQKGTMLYENTADLSPEECFEATFAVDGTIEDCAVTVMQGTQILVSYKVYKPKLEPVPKPADAIPAPEKLKTTEELYLAATHLEQYRHATREPADYYRHGLELDGTDIRLNNGYGLLLYRRGQIKESIKYFQAAVKKQTWKNPNPYHGEGYFNLGLALAADGQEEKAFDAFYKSTWSAETQSAGFFWLARLACRRGDYEEALEYIEKSLIRNWHNMKGRTLKAAILRKLGVDSTAFVKECLEIDSLSQGCLYEQAAATDDYDLWLKTMRTESHNFKELAQEYIEAGLCEDAICILEACPQKDPICWYTLGYVYTQLKEGEKAKEAFKNGEKSCPDYCFPNRVEEIRILDAAIEALQQAPMAHYYLGNLLYDKKQYEEAASHWKTAVKEKEDLSPAYRNLAIYYYNKENDAPKALEVMERACALDPEYPRIWLEYDQLSARMNLPVEKRLEIMESHPAVTAGRDDLYLRYLTLLNDVGRYQEALDGLASRQFHPWEGGEGKVSSQYKYALTHLAMAKLDEKQPQEALKLLEATLSYPNNLGEGKLPNVPDNEAHYYMGLAYKQLGETEKAEEYFHLAASGPQEPGSVLYYNDQPSDFIYYQGLANLELGLDHAAKKSFHQLLTFGEQHLFDEVEYDFFAVSLPEIEVFQEDLELRNIQYCNYLRALGHLGLDENEKARELFREILAKQSDYQGALAR